MARYLMRNSKKDIIEVPDFKALRKIFLKKLKSDDYLRSFIKGVAP